MQSKPLLMNARGNSHLEGKHAMRLSWKLLAAAALLVVGLAVSGAEAAPAGSGLAPLKSVPEASSSLVEKTYWVRRCYYTRYGRRCHRVWVKPHRHYRPYKYYRHRHYRHYRRYH